MALGFAACTNDVLSPDQSGDGNSTPQIEGQLQMLTLDQSRFIFGSTAQTKGTETNQGEAKIDVPAQPEIPDFAIELQPDENNVVAITESGDYVFRKDANDIDLQITPGEDGNPNLFRIYIDDCNIKVKKTTRLDESQLNSESVVPQKAKVNIYVLEGASFTSEIGCDGNIDFQGYGCLIPQDWYVESWGKFSLTPYDNTELNDIWVNIPVNSSLRIYSEDSPIILGHLTNDGRGGYELMTNSQVKITFQLNLKGGFAHFGGDTEIQNLYLEAANSYPNMGQHAHIVFGGNTEIKNYASLYGCDAYFYGYVDFYDSVLFAKDANVTFNGKAELSTYLREKPIRFQNNANVIVNNCTWFYDNIEVVYGADATLTVSDYMSETGASYLGVYGIKSAENSKLSIKLHDSMLDIYGDSSQDKPDNGLSSMIGTVKDITEGIVTIEGLEGDYYSVVKVEGDDLLIPGNIFSGNLFIEENGAVIKDETGDIVDNEEYSDFFSSDYSFPETCGYGAISGNDLWITPPTDPNGHKYSATGIAFNGETLYLCWHSNRSQDGDDQEDHDPNHDHGTNVEGDSEPSLDSPDDWGGIIDVVNFPAPTAAHFENTFWQDEHKYNHVAYNRGYIYLASTSYKVGAALHTIPVAGPTLSVSGAKRFNLTGFSANCVDFYNDQIITVSGRSEGGINWFTQESDRNQTENYINSDPTWFGGKYVVVHGEKVYVLHNPYSSEVNGKPEILVYNLNGQEIPGEKVTIDYELDPVDGKNVLAVDDYNLYVCCGKNGLHVYNKTNGAYVGGSKKNVADGTTVKNKFYAANGCDVDNNYIYVATGSGLLILDKNNIVEQGFKKIKYAMFKGVGFQPGSNNKTADGVVKESANFVKVRGDFAYVAYGMYGLRVYDIKRMLNNF